MSNHYKIFIVALAGMLVGTTAKAQLYIADTEFTTLNNALVFVDGDVTYAGNSLTTFGHNGLMEIRGNWFNASGADRKVFTDASTGMVNMLGGLQTFNGSITRFPNLTLSGTARKLQNTAVEVKDILNLTDKELDVNGHTITVLSTAVSAIDYSKGGYVNTSTNTDGWLVRNQAGSSYAYPLGNDGSRFRFRPLEIGAQKNGLVYVQFQNYNPGNDGFNPARLGEDVKGVYDQYYHRVKAEGNNTLGVTDHYSSTDDGDFSTLVEWNENTQVWDKLKSLGPLGSTSFRTTDSKFTAAELPVVADKPVPITFGTKAKLFIPNVFTPNGDRVNDFFHIEGLDIYAQCEMVIVNRWGNEVYKESNYGKEGHEWDGSELNEGVYFYILKVKAKSGEVEKYTGYVHLIRSK